jgi:hypothetical protein
MAHAPHAPKARLIAVKRARSNASTSGGSFGVHDVDELDIKGCKRWECGVSDDESGAPSLGGGNG